MAEPQFRQVRNPLKPRPSTLNVLANTHPSFAPLNALAQVLGGATGLEEADIRDRSEFAPLFALGDVLGRSGPVGRDFKGAHVGGILNPAILDEADRRRMLEVDNRLYPPEPEPRWEPNFKLTDVLGSMAVQPEDAFASAIASGPPGIGAAPELGPAPMIPVNQYEYVRGALGEMDPGQAPTPPTEWDRIKSGLASGLLYASGAPDWASAFTAGAGGGLAGQIAADEAYTSRMDQYSERVADLAVKRAEVETNLAQLDSAREMAQAQIDSKHQLTQAELQSNYDLTRAQLANTYAIHEANIAMERLKLQQPYVAVANNRLMVWERDQNGRPNGQPIMYTVNEVSDGVEKTLADAALAKALRGSASEDPTATVLQVGELKKTFRGPVGEALGAAMLVYKQNMNSTEMTQARQQITEQLFETNQFLDLSPDDLEARVESTLITQMALGLLNAAAEGQELPEVKDAQTDAR